MTTDSDDADMFQIVSDDPYVLSYVVTVLF